MPQKVVRKRKYESVYEDTMEDITDLIELIEQDKTLGSKGWKLKQELREEIAKKIRKIVKEIYKEHEWIIKQKRWLKFDPSQTRLDSWGEKENLGGDMKNGKERNY